MSIKPLYFFTLVERIPTGTDEYNRCDKNNCKIGIYIQHRIPDKETTECIYTVSKRVKVGKDPYCHRQVLHREECP